MFSKILNADVLYNEPLSKHCTFHIGGNAKYFISVHNIDALLNILHICQQHGLSYKIIGNGSNLLFDDLGYNGAIIRYDDNFKQIKDSKLYASAGCNMAELLAYTCQHNLGGLEFCVGVPAQLGGALTNNLGAYGNEICTYIEHITILDNNQIKYLTKEDCKFAYHASSFQNQYEDNKNLKTKNNIFYNKTKKSKPIILSAIFNLPFQDKNITELNMREYLTKRQSFQPLNFANAGSIFRRDNNIIPAKLIDEASLKGLTVGNAQISSQHAGFIINLGNATSKDVLTLIEIIKQTIYLKFNINLNLEIEYIDYKN